MFVMAFQAQENIDPSWVRVWLLDMALAGNGKVAVLMAAHNPNISQQLHYAIGEKVHKKASRKFLKCLNIQQALNVLKEN